MPTAIVDLRRRVRGWRAAERRERALRAAEEPLSPAAAFDAAVELYELFGDASKRPDVVRSREVAAARAAWRKLRNRLACRPTTNI